MKYLLICLCIFLSSCKITDIRLFGVNEIVYEEEKICYRQVVIWVFFIPVMKIDSLCEVNTYLIKGQIK